MIDPSTGAVYVINPIHYIVEKSIDFHDFVCFSYINSSDTWLQCKFEGDEVG